MRSVCAGRAPRRESHTHARGGAAQGTSDDRRWHRLNRSLARLTAVHDGAAAPGAAGTAGVSCAAAAGVAAPQVQLHPGGLVVDRVHDADRSPEFSPPPPDPTAPRQQQQREQEESVRSRQQPRRAQQQAQPHAQQEQQGAGGVGESDDWGGLWFEVSAHTARVHFHAAPDGSAPLRLSLPLECLVAEDSPLLVDLRRAVAVREAVASAIVVTPAHAAAAQSPGTEAPAAAGASAPAMTPAAGAAAGAGADAGGQERSPAAAGSPLGAPPTAVVISGVGVLALPPECSSEVRWAACKGAERFTLSCTVQQSRANPA